MHELATTLKMEAVFDQLVTEIPLKTERYQLDEYEIIRDQENRAFPPHVVFVAFEGEVFDASNGAYVSALLTFAFRRRFAQIYLPGFKPYGAKPMPQKRNPQASGISDQRLSFVRPPFTASRFSPSDEVIRFELANRLNKKIKALQTKDKECVVDSLRLYHIAHLVRRESIDLGFALLVSAMEAMSRSDSFIRLEHTWEKYVDYKDWEELFGKYAFQPGCIDEMKALLISKERKLSKRFRQFIIENLPVTFWTEPDDDAVAEINERQHESIEMFDMLQRSYDIQIRSAEGAARKDLIEKKEEHAKYDPRSSKSAKEEAWYLFSDPFRERLTKANLESMLKNAYGFRSRFFHEGSHPEGIDLDGYTAEVISHFEFPKEMTPGSVVYPKETLIPNFKLMERMVRDSILTFFKVV